MKANFSQHNNRAMTILEVLVVCACLLIVAALILPPTNNPRRAQRINCVANLKQVNLAFLIWEGDRNNQNPMDVSVTNGGGRELIEAGNVGGMFRVVLSNEFSNELSTKILDCPADQSTTIATNWNDIDSSHISYFFGADATNGANPDIVFNGDDNLIVGGTPLKSGMLELFSNTPVSWSGARHKFCGNLGFADGSVRQVDQPSLQQAFQRTGLATNRIAIP